MLGVFPLNQYKVLVVTSRRISLLNTRSLQQGPFLLANNITRIATYQHQAEIIAVCRHQNTLLLLLGSGELARYSNERILSSHQLPRLHGELPLLPFHTVMQVLGNHLFVIDQLRGQIRVFTSSAGRFLFTLALSLPRSSRQEKKHYELYQERESIRLIESSHNQSSIYEVLLPVCEEASSSLAYLKILGVVAVIALLLYFKLGSKEGTSPKEVGGGKVGGGKELGAGKVGGKVGGTVGGKEIGGNAPVNTTGGSLRQN